jgi:hypothetical protein
MTEAIITGLFTLFGTVIGAVITILFEVIRRSWSSSDRKQDRRMVIIDKRCEQSENYLQVMTEDFQKEKNDAIDMLLNQDRRFAIQRRNEYINWKNSLDLRIFALGPALGSFGDKEIKDDFNLMVKEMEKVQKIYSDIFLIITATGSRANARGLIKNLNDAWIKYSRLLSKIYHRIDEIREMAPK